MVIFASGTKARIANLLLVTPILASFLLPLPQVLLGKGLLLTSSDLTLLPPLSTTFVFVLPLPFVEPPFPEPGGLVSIGGGADGLPLHLEFC